MTNNPEPTDALHRLDLLANAAKTAVDQATGKSDERYPPESELNEPENRPSESKPPETTPPLSDRADELLLRNDAPSLRESPRQRSTQRRWPVLVAACALACLALFVLADATSDPGREAPLTADIEQAPTASQERVPNDLSNAAPVVRSATPSTSTPAIPVLAMSEPAREPTVWELVGSEPGTTMFAELVDPAWLQATLEPRLGPDGEALHVTFLVPSNEALAALSATQQTELANNPSAAKALISDHIVDVRLDKKAAAGAPELTVLSRSGVPVRYQIDAAGVLVNGQSRLLAPALEASNGVVLVIDTVLENDTVLQAQRD